MRRVLVDIAERRELGDVTMLTDPTVVQAIDDSMADRNRQGGRRGLRNGVLLAPRSDAICTCRMPSRHLGSLRRPCRAVVGR